MIGACWKREKMGIFVHLSRMVMLTNALPCAPFKQTVLPNDKSSARSVPPHAQPCAIPLPLCCFYVLKKGTVVRLASTTVRATLRRYSAFLLSDLVQFYYPIWCIFYVPIWYKFICWFSINLCSNLVQFYVVPPAINWRAIKLVKSSWFLGIFYDNYFY